MKTANREKLQYVTGVLSGLSYVLESNVADALCDMIADIDMVLAEEKEDK